MDSDIVTTAASTSTGGADVAATAALSNPQRPIQTPSPTASPIKPQSYLSQQSVNSTMSAREMRRFQRAVNSLTQLHQNAEEGQSPIVGGDLKTKITSSPRETRRILLSQQQLQLQQQPPADGLIQQQRQQQQLLADPEPSEHASKRPIARVCKTDIISPTGDDHLILEPEDFMMPRKHSNTETTPVGKKQHSQPLFGSSRPHTDDDGEGKDEEGIIYVQDRERFRRTTISEAQAMQQRMESSKDVYKQDRTEHRLIRLMKKIHLYTVAVSYCSYGLAAGLGLATLIIIPFSSPAAPTLTADTTSMRYLEFAGSAFVRFLSFYSRNSMGLSNAFSILTTIILLHAIDTRSSLHETRRKIEDGSLKKDPISAGSTAVTHSLLRRRMLIAATMVSFAWFAFLANIILVCVDDRLAETDYMTSQATDSIANSPYYTYRGSVPPGMTAELDWYWGPVLDGSASSSSSLLPDLIRQDMSILFPLSAVRGISLICCWALGLVEIKLRSAPKRSPKLVA